VDPLGLRPAALLGHSIGQYAAACLAGVFSLDDALTLVGLRGAAVQAMPPGAMLAVHFPRTRSRFARPAIDLAAVNAPSLCVVAGPHAPIAALAQRLRSQGVNATPLHTSHAFHSHMVEPRCPCSPRRSRASR